MHSADMLDIMDMLGIVDMINLVAMMDMLDKVMRLKLMLAHKNTESRKVCFYFLMPMVFGRRFTKICFESF